jgi:hypothetical protein
VNVSLPQLSTHAMPVKTLPGAATISEKFSISLAEAQDTADASMPAVLNGSGSHVPKKSSARSDKSSSKSSSANDGSTFSKSTLAVNTAAQEVRAALVSAARPSWRDGSRDGVRPAGYDRLQHCR